MDDIEEILRRYAILNINRDGQGRANNTNARVVNPFQNNQGAVLRPRNIQQGNRNPQGNNHRNLAQNLNRNNGINRADQVRANNPNARGANPVQNNQGAVLRPRNIQQGNRNHQGNNDQIQANNVIRNNGDRNRRGRNRAEHANGNRNNDGERRDISGNRNRGGMRGGRNDNRRGNGHENRGMNRNRRDQPNARSQTPQMDWFEMEEARAIPRARSVDNVALGHIRPARNNYGGRYNIEQDETEQRDQRNPNRGNRMKHDRRNDNIGFKRLQDISTMEADQIILILLKDEVGFDKMIKEKLSEDKIVLILRVVKKICETVFTQNVGVVLSTLCEQDFIDQLTNYIQCINLQERRDKHRNKFFWDDTDQFWNSLVEFFEAILKLKPYEACKVLPKIMKATEMTVRMFYEYHNVNVQENIKEKLEELQVKIVLCIEERDRKKNLPGTTGEEELDEPPDDFRQIPLYPLASEVLSSEEVFLRSNIVKGKYQSVEHYLDVQFRLLREDFVAPLRQGIYDYTHQNQYEKRKKIFDVKFYPKVQFIKSETQNNKVIKIVQFVKDPKKLKMKFENSRRLMFGSLVCFTNDNFEKIIFGTISERKIELLKKGQVGIELENDIIYNKDYLMMECCVYFEPYYHVLKALQIMDVDTFPLSKYIIDVSNEPQPPAYLQHSTEIIIKNPNVDLKFQRPGLPGYKTHFNTVILSPYWPSATDLGLDNSQYGALKAALTNEFCVIQGPPGTGKTYIGLRITEILLDNSHIWNTGPILVICFTNHALDQFLEGILQYTQKIARVGGQSKNEILKPFNIRELRYKEQRNRLVGQNLSKKIEQLKKSMLDIKSVQTMIDAITANDRIIDIRHLKEINQLDHSWLSQADKSSLLDWLLGGRNDEDRYQERRKVRMNEAKDAQSDESDAEGSDDDFYDAENLEQERIIHDADKIDVDVEQTSIYRITLATIDSLQNEHDKLVEELQNMEDIAENAYVLYDPKAVQLEEIEKTESMIIYLQYRFDQHKYGNVIPPPQNVDYDYDPSLLTPNERWGLYWKLVDEYYNALVVKLEHLESEYRDIYRQYEEIRSMEDIRLMKTMKVIGMTTTGAARYQTILQAIKSPIVIVEEAAEVLESHVVVSLTNACQHLILIGDHKQLRPTTAVYRLATKYNLEISLFERMVKNDIQCHTLDVQHRMRPEIAKLIVPAIYPKLENDISVHSYPPVQGVTSNLFFITHKQEETLVADSSSRMNVYEAQFLIKLAHHFVLQGYDPSEITILTTYSGQMFCLWRERKNEPFLRDVRITVVDNFQGEENKIILLSLVRSNPESNIGFLKTINRVCVALSRAKEGFFIIGNMDNLTKSSDIWPKIKATLEEQNNIGTELILKCQIHPDQLTPVKEVRDFLKISEGGCTLLCGKQLNCGHTCASLCHITDREHNEYACKEPCTKILCDVGHPCPDLCYKVCRPCRVPMQRTLPCGHIHWLPCHIDTAKYICPTLVDVTLDCGHNAKKPCHEDIEKFPCPHPCEIRKLCGHKCDKTCHIKNDPDHLQIKCFQPCGKFSANCSTNSHNCPLKCFEECPQCEVIVQKQRTVCIHRHDVSCCVDVDKIVCEKRCDKVMLCGHKCRMKCCEPCGNCQVKVDKAIAICGHKLKVKCCEEPNRKQCIRKCPLLLTCGHACQNRCNQECTTRCSELVDNPFDALCGHTFKIPCYKREILLTKNSQADINSYNILQHCQNPCGTLLSCEHTCSGTCGTCVQGRIHLSCQEQCGASLICGHQCEIPCRETCQPCGKKCEYRCVHSKCPKKCGEPCVNCVEPCPRNCEHVRCRKKCWELCTVEACTEPCLKILKCGHPCVGFCGDPCPPICRICDPENEAFEVLFGNEDEPDARFIYLEECKHSIEAEAMDNWLLQGTDDKKDEEINIKRCPRCKTAITKNKRYSNYIKIAYKDITAVKEKLFGNYKDNAIMMQDMNVRITTLTNRDARLTIQSMYLMNVLSGMQKSLQPAVKGKRQVTNKIVMNAYEAQLEIIERLIKIYMKSKLNQPESINKCIQYIDFLLIILLRQQDRITKQEINDFQLEISKFEKLCNVLMIEEDPNFRQVFASQVSVKRIHTDIWSRLNSIKKFTFEQNDYLKINIKALIELVNKNIQITAEEKAMIVKAMGMAQGHWYKCPNGHTYCITECGGAMEVSKCNECGAPIGGSNHALLSTNRHDGSMDGSSRAAWSNAANLDMRNFHFED